MPPGSQAQASPRGASRASAAGSRCPPAVYLRSRRRRGRGTALPPAALRGGRGRVEPAPTDLRQPQLGARQPGSAPRDLCADWSEACPSPSLRPAHRTSANGTAQTPPCSRPRPRPRRDRHARLWGSSQWFGRPLRRRGLRSSFYPAGFLHPTLTLPRFPHIDTAPHTGGSIGGAGLAFYCAQSWSPLKPIPEQVHTPGGPDLETHGHCLLHMNIHTEHSSKTQRTQDVDPSANSPRTYARRRHALSVPTEPGNQDEQVSAWGPWRLERQLLSKRSTRRRKHCEWAQLYLGEGSEVWAKIPG